MVPEDRINWLVPGYCKLRITLPADPPKRETREHETRQVEQGFDVRSMDHLPASALPSLYKYSISSFAKEISNF